MLGVFQNWGLSGLSEKTVGQGPGGDFLWGMGLDSYNLISFLD